MSEREAMEFDVVIVGAGPSGLAAAIRLKQLAAAGHPIGNHTYDHVNVKANRPEDTQYRFARAPWLVAVFTSATCNTCAGVWEKAMLLASDDVAVQRLEAVERKDLHTRYGVTAVPGLVVADAEGVVRARFLGPVTATDLWATVAELREPGSLPDAACDHGVSPG